MEGTRMLAKDWTADMRMTPAALVAVVQVSDATFEVGTRPAWSLAQAHKSFLALQQEHKIAVAALPDGTESTAGKCWSARTQVLGQVAVPSRKICVWLETVMQEQAADEIEEQAALAQRSARDMRLPDPLLAPHGLTAVIAWLFA